KPEALDQSERAELMRHPIHAMAVLRRFDRLPLAVPAVAYREHERLDGSGYPDGAAGDEAGPFARIVAACDVLEGLCTGRPDRDALLPHASMRELIQLASRRQLDTVVVRGLLRVLSSFPIGSWV